MILNTLDVPATALRFAAEKGWGILPKCTTDAVQKFVANRSWVTRSAVKATISGAILGGAIVAGTGPLGLTAAAIGSCIAGRTLRIDQVKTGQDLPADPREVLRDAAHNIVRLAAGSNTPKTIPLPLANAPEERPPPPAVDVAAQRRETDRSLHTLILNGSIAATIGFIHGNRLGLTVDPVLLPKIVFEASQSNASLWSIYIKYLGRDFTLCQRIRACFWYFLSYSLGIIPNSIHTFMTNILREARNHFQHPTQPHSLDRGVRNILDQLSSLLEVYNQSTRNYARADCPTGDVDSYRRRALEQFGDKSVKQLTEEFCTTVVDQFFPQIPFFETLKQYPVIGWFFTILDWFLGGIINCVGRKVLKAKLPAVVQEFMTDGIDASNLTNLQFSIAITNAMTELIRDVGNTSIANEPPPFRPVKLPVVIEKLLETLELNGSAQDPLDTQPKLRKQIEHMDRRACLHYLQRKGHTMERDKLRDGLVNGVHALITHMNNNSEELFANVLDLLNAAFSETALQTPEDYNNAFEELERTAQKAFHDVIYAGLEGSSFAEQRATYDQLYDKYKRMLDDTVRHLNHYGQEMANRDHPPEESLRQIDLATRVLKQLTESPLINKARDAGPAVEQAFYASFHPLQKELPALTTDLLELQVLFKKRQADLATNAQLERISTTLQHIAERPEERLTRDNLATLCHQLQQIHVPISAPIVAQIQAQIGILEQRAHAIEAHKRLVVQHAQYEALQAEQTRLLSTNRQKSNFLKGRKLTPYRRPLHPSIEEAPPPEAIDLAAHAESLRGAANALAATQRAIGEIRHTQEVRQASYPGELTEKLRRLQATSAQVTQVYRLIQPSHVEKLTIFYRLWYKGLAKCFTPRAMKRFGQFYGFLTTRDPYDGLRRVFMQTVVDTYQ